jgi:hypothetical protein
MNTTVLGYDEPAKKLLAVTAKSISAAAAGAPSLTAGKEHADRGPHSKSCWKRDARAVQQEKAAQIDTQANRRAVDKKARCCLVDLSVKCPPPSSPSEAQVIERKNEKSSEGERASQAENAHIRQRRFQSCKQRPSANPQLQAKAQRTSPKSAKEANVVREEVQVLAQQVAIAQTVETLVHMRAQPQPEQQQHAFHSEAGLGLEFSRLDGFSFHMSRS